MQIETINYGNQQKTYLVLYDISFALCKMLEILATYYDLTNSFVICVVHCVSKKTSPMFLAITRESIVGFS